MKLETLLAKDYILAIDALGRGARLTAEDIIRGYERDVAEWIARELGRIALNTKDKDAVIESARIIGRYEGDTARGVAGGLRGIARNTKDKETVMESARVIGRYEGGTASNVAWELAYIAGYTEDKETVMESARVIGRYEGEAVGGVAWGLGETARNTKDKETVIKVAKIMSLDEVVRTVRRCEGWAAHDVAWELTKIARNTEDKETVMTACRLVNTTGSGVFDLLDAKDVVSIWESRLDKLIDGKSSFDAVAAYVKSGKELPLPTSENIADYGKLVKDHLSSAYGMDKELDNGRLLMLFSIDEKKRKGLAGLVNKSTERDRKEYSVSDGGDKMDIDRSKLPYLLLLAVTGSRDKLKEEEAFRLASGIVGEKAVNRARNSFNSSYKSKLPEIISYVKKDEVDKAIMTLRETKDESINDVLACMDYRDTGFSGGNAVLSAVESNDPLDYDSRVQIACVYLPRSYNEGIYEYCKDDRFTLVRYDIGGKTLGSAICYMEDGTFLVDSVEGHRTFRKPKIFDAVRRDLMERAKEKGAKRILFSEGGTNETPKKFMDYLGHLGLKKGKIKMKLDTEGYLEADEDGASGYVWEP